VTKSEERPSANRLRNTSKLYIKRLKEDRILKQAKEKRERRRKEKKQKDTIISYKSLKVKLLCFIDHNIDLLSENYPNG